MASSGDLLQRRLQRGGLGGFRGPPRQLFRHPRFHHLLEQILQRLNVDSGQLRLIRPDGGRELP